MKSLRVFAILIAALLCFGGMRSLVLSSRHSDDDGILLMQQAEKRALQLSFCYQMAVADVSENSALDFQKQLFQYVAQTKKPEIVECPITKSPFLFRTKPSGSKGEVILLCGRGDRVLEYCGYVSGGKFVKFLGDASDGVVLEDFAAFPVFPK